MAFNITTNDSYNIQWDDKKIKALRFFTIFFALSFLPLDGTFYSLIFETGILNLNAYEWVALFSYYPKILLDGSEFGLFSFIDLILLLVASIIGTILWGIFCKDKSINYDNLYYWLRVGVRYRLAIALIGYGLLKIFVLQIPYPSLSNLHTNYGDFLPWKIYFHTVGIVQGYESFLGFVEFLAGILLLYRKTATFGAAIALGFIGNIFMANYAYQIGDHNFTLYLLIFASFIFAYDAPRLYNLLYLQKKTVANRFQPNFSEPKLKNLRVSLKTLFFVALFILGYKSFSSFSTDPYLIPKEAGLKEAYGFYNVREFVFNNDTIPYSIDHHNRWQNVVFEKWATLSVKIARPVSVDLSLVKDIGRNKDVRNYESAGVGDRHYFSYEIDSINHQLTLQNKNKHHIDEGYKLTFSKPDKNTIILEGTDEKGNRIHAVLDRIERKYMLYEGRRYPVKL